MGVSHRAEGRGQIYMEVGVVISASWTGEDLRRPTTHSVGVDHGKPRRRTSLRDTLRSDIWRAFDKNLSLGI